MKIKFVILMFVFSFCAKAQKKDVQVEYKVFCNTDIPLVFNATLAISNNVSIYKEKYSTTERWKEQPTKYEDDDVTKPADVFEPYYKIDHTKKELLFFDQVSVNVFLVKDNYITLKWNITEEKKTISGLSCIKATTNFRGREWSAWFTPEIPLSFGPCKVHGLPGLILEPSDRTGRYTIKASSIEFKKSDVFSKDFSNLHKTKNINPISYQQLITDRDESHRNFLSSLSQNGNFTVTEQKAPRNGEELVFEWEK